MPDEHKSLYRKHLEKNGFVSTRAADLDKAVKKLHAAICELDLHQLEIAQEILKTDLRGIINEFGKIEELRRGF